MPKNEPKIAKGLFKVTKIGDSYYILLNKTVRAVMSVTKGKVLDIIIREPQTLNIVCTKCKRTYIDYKENRDRSCPYCGFYFYDDLQKGEEDERR